MSGILNVLDVGVSYAGTRRLDVLGRVTLSVKENSFTSIVGPSGCGKTTLLRCISGLQRPTSGEVFVKGSKVIEPTDGMSIVFQEYNRSLLPWRSVLGNVLLGVEGRLPKGEALGRATDLLKEMGLSGFEKFYPWQLSGGMQQRVAIARALVSRPEILLMDEPFASVDAQTRMLLEDLLLRLWKEYSLTVLFVTHDIDESVYLSQRVVLLSKRPSTVMEDLQIELAYPRHQVKTRGSQEFSEYRTSIFEKIIGLI
ncbi:MAG: ABC transporter ATP-binding protein [Nitrososphaerota archaeon]|nr:ABC transporter ATP-binding protein [Nitrososphaerota archaeon]